MLQVTHGTEVFMQVLISANGKYIVMYCGIIENICNGLNEAVTYIRQQGKKPEFCWDNE